MSVSTRKRPRVLHIATALAGFSIVDIEHRSDRRRPRISAEDRAAVYARPESTCCAYCTTPLHKRAKVNPRGYLPNSWRTIDHMVALSAGGANQPENMTTVCYMCNLMKGDTQLADFLASVYLQTRRQLALRRSSIKNRQAA